jgi:VanZ family protein
LARSIVKIGLLKYYTPAVLWGIFITVYTLIPLSKLPPKLLDANDKLLHMAIYFFTAALIYLGRQRYKIKATIASRFLWLTFLGCTLYGGLIEILQHFFVTNRHGEWLDFLANSLGALFALFAFKCTAYKA